ncbi:hypothetical protein F2Q70_00011386 [Brassica cretica]|uniref:Uncharacterized protein n=1 Tax=Brassica cretica TaxID=69181 RepID=A0A8S9LVU7_BRACR|nr:hypothetical protein F2Q70_00011386 [Brassica cretica]KAF3552399.1 hypothetical protein DY000_02006614 [Brassica cretica]
MDSQGHGAVCVRSPPWLLLNVWKNRNSILYAATQESPTFWVSNVEEEAKIWEKVNKKAQNMKVQDSMLGDREFWCSPSPGVVKCNVHINWRNGVLQSGELGLQETTLVTSYFMVMTRLLHPQVV